MPTPKVSFLTSLSNVVFAKRHAAAQAELWQICSYGAKTAKPGDKTIIERMEYQISRGAKLDVQDKNGDTPLIIFARRAMTDEALFVINNHADVFTRNNKGENAFMAAAAAGDGTVVRKLVEDMGVDARETTPEGRTAAQLMVHANHDFKGDAELKAQAGGLCALLSRGVTLDESLKMAIYHHHPHLLDAAPEMAPVYSLSLSAAKGDEAHVQMLVTLGVKPDRPAQYNDNTPLCAATMLGKAAMMETLIAGGADINLKSPKTHRTPIETAARYGQREAFALLVDSGATITAGMNLLELARDSGSKGMVRDVYDALIDKGIMKTEVVMTKAAMRTIKLKTPTAGAG